MNQTVLLYAIAALIGLICGMAGTLMAPWVHWGIEKRKQRQTKRRELIQTSRSILLTEIGQQAFRETEVYAQLKPHLIRDVIDAIEKNETDTSKAAGNDSGSDFKKRLFEDIARIEREWILI